MGDAMTEESRTQIAAFLLRVFEQSSSDEESQRLNASLALISQGQRRNFFIAFAGSARFYVNGPLSLSEDDLKLGEQLLPGLKPELWDRLQLARILMLVSLPAGDKSAFLQTLQMLFDTSDLGEQTAMYAAFPLLPWPFSLQLMAAEGIRTSMTDVFAAIALHNPYPFESLDENTWNQMVLKTLFMGLPLYKVVGIDARHSLELATMLSDYAHERWAAGRVVSPELWRIFGHYASQFETDIVQLASSTDPLERAAAALVAESGKLSLTVASHSDAPLSPEKKGSEAWDDLGKLWEEKQAFTAQSSVFDTTEK